MKHIAGTILLHSFFISAQQAPIIPVNIPQDGKIILIIPPININAQSSSGVESTSNISTTTTTTTQVVQPSIQEQPLYTSLMAFIHNHWFGCSCVALGAVYSTLVSYILYVRHRIQHTHIWSSWQRHQTMEQLMLQPHETLKTALIKDITAQYINPDNPTDQVWPLTEFISACKREEKELRRYLMIAAFLRKTGLYKIMPTLTDDYAQLALTKLLFVYHLFAAWSADITWQQLQNKDK